MKKKRIKNLLAMTLLVTSIAGAGNSAYAATVKGDGSDTEKLTSNVDLNSDEKDDGWELRGKDGKEYFYKDGVLQKNGIITVWGVKYKCDADGVIVGEILSDSDDVDKYMHQFSEDYKNNDKRWKKVDGNWHYCEDPEEYSEKKIVKNGWIGINQYWYHFDENGNMDKNTTIKDECGNECQLNSDGALVNREEPEFKEEEEPEFKFIEKDGKTYCIDLQGNKKTGWIMKGDWWYFCNSDGIVQKNISIIDNGQKYILDQNGAWIR